MEASMPYWKSLLACLVVLTANASVCIAGNNAGTLLRLTWDPEGRNTFISQFPTGPFPLYLHLSADTDIRQLAINLRWFPYDTTEAYYRILPAGPDSASGWITAVPPEGPFDGDSSYTWSIVFPPKTSHRRITAWFLPALADTVPYGVFEVSLARAMDSAGQIDTIGVFNQAVIFASREGLTPLVSLDPLLARDERFLNEQDLVERRDQRSIRLAMNPTRSEAVVLVRQQAESQMDMRVFDVAGRQVTAITFGRLPAGEHRLKWDLRDSHGKNVQPGQYFVVVGPKDDGRVVRLTVSR
jgi:hypothetical protein